MGAFVKLAAFLWRHRSEVIEVEEAIRALVTSARAQRAAPPVAAP